MPEIAAPPEKEIEALLGPTAFAAWRVVNEYVAAQYDMQVLWFPGRKDYAYEMKYRRGGKTLCSLYPRKDAFGFMVIFGKAEREKFEADAAAYSPAVLETYKSTKIYHDGLWLMLDIQKDAPMEDIRRLLAVKRRPAASGKKQ